VQANRKTKEGADNPDRDGQFKHINEQVAVFLQDNQLVISVDTKKKELVGDFKNAGQEWQPQGKPVEVKGHDFPDPDLGKANPYGVYDQGANIGWVSVGTDHDTVEFAVESIRRWWNKIEHRMFSHITMNWRGRPLVSYETIVNLIESTTPQAGLAINAELDVNPYEKGIRVSDGELEMVNLTKAEFHGEWNYSIAVNCSS
jgi:hypothetical protein